MRARLYFADEESARRGAKLVRLGRDGLRALTLMGVAELSALDCMPDLLGPGDVSDVELVADAPEYEP